MSTFTVAPTIPGLISSADYHSYQFYIVQMCSTANKVKLGTSATSKCIGALQNDPKSGQAALIPACGVGQVLAEASVTQGDLLTCSSTGRAKTTTTQGHRVIGTALSASSAAGDIIRYLVVPSGI